MSKLNIKSVLLIEQISSMCEDRRKFVLKKSKEKCHIIQNLKGKKLDTTITKSGFYLAQKFDRPELNEERASWLITRPSLEDLSKKEKLLFISNILLPDDEKFIEYCLRANLDKDFFERINKLVYTLRLFRKETTNPTSTKIDELNQFTEYYYGFQNSSIIVNKANQILVENPQLLIKK